MSVNEHDWHRRETPKGAWEAVAKELRERPAGTRVLLWWYGPRTAPNGAWMRDKCRRLGISHVEIEHRAENGTKATYVYVPDPHPGRLF